MKEAHNEDGGRTISLTSLMRQIAEYEVPPPPLEELAEDKRKLLAWMAEASPPADADPNDASQSNRLLRIIPGGGAPAEAPDASRQAPALQVIAADAAASEPAALIARSHTPAGEAFAPRPADATQPAGSFAGNLSEEEWGVPTVLRMALGAQLRLLREGAGLTIEDVSEALCFSVAKITRLEVGRAGYKERDVADLLALYGVTDEAEREEFLRFTHDANSPGWWQEYSDVMAEWFAALVDLEAAASLIRTYEVQFVPGLLQTEAYAREVARLGLPQAPDSEIQHRVDLRMQRQHILTRDQGPRLWAVIDQAVLSRPLGDANVMRDQINHLLEAAKLPRVILQVAPFSVGGHAAAGGPVTILRFQSYDLADIVYLEQLTGATYLDKKTEVEHYLTVMDQLSAQALSPTATEDFLKKLLREYNTGPTGRSGSRTAGT